MDNRAIRRRPTHVGVINQELWSAHGRRRALGARAPEQAEQEQSNG